MKLCPMRFREFADDSQQVCIGGDCAWFLQCGENISMRTFESMETALNIADVETQLEDMTKQRDLLLAKVDGLTAELERLETIAHHAAAYGGGKHE